MKRTTVILSVALVMAALASPAGAAAPLPPIERLPVPVTPEVSAASWILYDATNDVILASLDADAPRAMASTTKMMTALVALENLAPGATTTVSTAADAVGEAEVGLVAGEVVPVEPLVAALLIRSGNDAAIAVAEAVAGSVEAFVEMMNDRASELGLTSTRFVNPHGLDATGHQSSARDLLSLALTAMENDTFAEAVGTRRMRLPDAPDGSERLAETTNRLLYDYPGALGVKTGYTFRAGLVLVAAAERDGRRLYAVVMGSEDGGGHFRDASALLDYGFDTLRLVPAVIEGARYREIPPEELAALSAQATFESLLHLSAMPTAAGAVEMSSVAAPTTVTLGPSSLPGIGEALRWLFGGDR